MYSKFTRTLSRRIKSKKDLRTPGRKKSTTSEYIQFSTKFIIFAPKFHHPPIPNNRNERAIRARHRTGSESVAIETTIGTVPHEAASDCPQDAIPVKYAGKHESMRECIHINILHDGAPHKASLPERLPPPCRRSLLRNLPIRTTKYCIWRKLMNN